MCFEADSLPPIPVLSGAAVSHDDLVLISADGTEFAAFSARPDGPVEACVVVMPDVRGLYRFYEELALRFAERGFAAVAIDYFGRTAGVAKRGDDFEYMPHVGETKPELIQADVAAAIEHLRGSAASPSSRSASASAAATRGSRQRPATACAARSASTATRPSETASSAPPSARASSRLRSSRCRRATTRTSRRT